MDVFDSGTAVLGDEFGIRVGRWEQQYSTDGLPFDAMWCVVPPGSKADEDDHAERELQIVVSGHGALESTGTGETVDIRPGMAMLLAPHERHVLHNHSADDPLVVLSVYWIPGQAPAPRTLEEDSVAG